MLRVGVRLAAQREIASKSKQNNKQRIQLNNG